MPHIWIAAAALALSPVGQDVPAPPPTVASFLADYATIQTDPDKPAAAARMTRWIQIIGPMFKRYKEELAAAEKAGTHPRACPRKGSVLNFTGDELAAELAALPQAERDGPLDQALFAFLDRRNPCPMA